MDYENGRTRSGRQAKKRKTNIILNSLIVLVILLIIFVSANIFFGNNDEKATNEVETSEENTEKDESQHQEQQQSESSNEQEQTESESTDASEEASSNLETETEGTTENEEAIVTEGGSPNVKKTIVNPSWKPVGTSQTGEHTAVYSQESPDWEEMLQAISYGSGVDQGNMTLWFLGNNGPNRSVATISTKDTQQAYRVYIEWIDGEGWKPEKVQELKENDKGKPVDPEAEEEEESDDD
ncbi:YrrS family protein [Cytobacillus spongiae]|jgi:cytoskeletal protein RodZ|uniref:YrrS family protein n=1 Tax=Cytobacillus spongiae TaxID=2901381 RepID=UPI001F38F214|nr:YrrS family protein [Cytobacillus spongiae]UII54967.1 YrrS family protein [Cytobacillus spongiae]